MPVLIACIIAGVCIAGLVTIWFTNAYNELSEKRNCLAALYEQLRFHERMYAQSWDGPDARSSAEMLETSRLLYREAKLKYNHILRKPVNCIPAFLMGFRAVGEDDRQGFAL